MAGGEGSRMEEKDCVENKILSELMEKESETGGVKRSLVGIGEAENLYWRGCYAFSIFSWT